MAAFIWQYFHKNFLNLVFTEHQFPYIIEVKQLIFLHNINGIGREAENDGQDDR